MKSPTSSKPASPEFRGCLDRDVSSCLVRDPKKSSKKSSKIEDGKNEGVFVFLLRPCPIHVNRRTVGDGPCDLPEVPVRDCICHGHLAFHVPKKDMQRFHDDFTKTSAFLPVFFNSKIVDFKTDVGGFTDAFQVSFVSFVSSLRFYFHVSAFFTTS